MLASLVECLETEGYVNCSPFVTDSVLTGEEKVGLEQFTLLHIIAADPNMVDVLQLYNTTTLSISLEKHDRYANTPIDLALFTHNSDFISGLHNFPSFDPFSS